MQISTQLLSHIYTSISQINTSMMSTKGCKRKMAYQQNNKRKKKQHGQLTTTLTQMAGQQVWRSGECLFICPVSKKAVDYKTFLKGYKEHEKILLKSKSNKRLEHSSTLVDSDGQSHTCLTLTSDIIMMFSDYKNGSDTFSVDETIMFDKMMSVALQPVDLTDHDTMGDKHGASRQKCTTTSIVVFTAVLRKLVHRDINLGPPNSKEPPIKDWNEDPAKRDMFERARFANKMIKRLIIDNNVKFKGIEATSTFLLDRHQGRTFETWCTNLKAGVYHTKAKNCTCKTHMVGQFLPQFEKVNRFYDVMSLLRKEGINKMRLGYQAESIMMSMRKPLGLVFCIRQKERTELAMASSATNLAFNSDDDEDTSNDDEDSLADDEDTLADDEDTLADDTEEDDLQEYITDED